MKYFIFIITSFKRKPLKNALIGLIFLFTFTGMLMAFQLLLSTLEATESAYNQIGIYMELDLDYSLDDRHLLIIDDELVDFISSIDHVTAVNQRIADYARPVNFKNVKDYVGKITNETETYGDLVPEGVIVDSNVSVSFLDDFRLGNSILIKGVYPSETNPGVLIEERLAKQNNLVPGDLIIIESTLNDISVTVLVQGIYRTSAEFEVTENNTLGEAIFAMSPYNRIYADIDTGEYLFERDSENCALDIYIDSVENMETVAQTIKGLGLDWNVISLYNMTESRYSSEAKNLSVLNNYSKLLLIICAAFGLILISVIYSITARQYHYEGSILMALGETKIQVMLAYVFQNLALGSACYVMAVILGLFINPVVISAISNTVPEVWAGAAAYNSGLLNDYSLKVAGLTMENYITAYAMSVVIVLISTIGIYIYFVKNKPRKILAERDK